jgi:Type I phosphodiesterase / nucleotide pyrophosphatase
LRVWRSHRVDDWALRVQSVVDRVARWARRGPDAPTGIRRFLVVQIDGLSAEVLDRALTSGHVPHLARLLRSDRMRRAPMSVGLPSSTPAFQAAAMYGVHPDIPGFHYYDKRTGIDLHFPKPGVADLVERAVSNGQRGILEGGACYGCVFTGGADESLTTFARLMKPTRAGLPLLRGLLSVTLLGWVTVKCVGLTAAELARFVSRACRRRRGERRWEGKRLGLKIGFSVWVRQFFTLAVSADLYRGVPAIYVNYLDYDVFAHAFGPAHPAAIRALRRLDRSIWQLARIVRRLPELRYDLYVCSDHGQASTRPFGETSGGRSIDEVVRAILAERSVRGEARLASASRPAVAAHDGPAREKGLRQRFFNHAGWPGFSEVPRNGTRVIAAGPNAFVYFLDSPEPLLSDEIERRYPGVFAELSAHPGIGLVLVRSSAGASCWWRGRQISLEGDGADGPFAARADRDLVLSGLRDLMGMPSAGDIVLYGIGAPQGDVSFIPERGAHAGPSASEMRTFILYPPSAAPFAAPLTHPVQLYRHFAAYAQGGESP